MANTDSKDNNLASLLSGIFGIMAGNNGSQQSEGAQTSLLEESKKPKDGTATSEGITGPVATVKSGNESLTSDSGMPWQQELAQRVKDAAMKAVEKQTSNQILSGADPTSIIQGAEDAITGSLTGQQVFQATQQQASGIDQNVLGQIKDATSSPKVGVTDWLFGGPKWQQAMSHAEAMGKVGPDVMQTYMTNQLPLGTEKKAELAAGAWQAQTNAALTELERIGQLKQQMAPLLQSEADLTWKPAAMVGFRTGDYKKASKQMTGYAQPATDALNRLTDLAGSHPNANINKAPVNEQAQQRIAALKAKLDAYHSKKGK
jgi:hypothetical protein